MPTTVSKILTHCLTESYLYYASATATVFLGNL